MINILLAVLFALGLVTSGGVTVAASQSAAPDDILYSVRTWSEDARLAMADSDTEAELALQFAEKYMEQMKHELANKGEISGPFVNRFAEMFERANGWAIELPDTASEDARTPDKARQFSGEANPTVDTDLKGAGTRDRLQTLVDTTLELTATGAIDPVMIQKHDRDRINDNANAGQPRNAYQHSMPVDGVLDGITGNPWLTDTITSTTPYSFTWATPNLDGPRMPDQAGSGPGSGPNYNQP